ncbi:MAG TPA: Asp-tRNA(Asn)/Glu-tRNA(Gln) amidotransferase subunit GatB, partial [Acidimicrobiales bacterium]
SGERVIQQTRHWNEDEGRTHMLRSKEEAEDYRYFPEPDLVPMVPAPSHIDAIDAALPELPAERRRTLADASGRELPDESVTIVVDRDLDELATAAIAAGADPDRTLTHLQHDLDPTHVGNVTAEGLAALVRLETSGALTASQAKQVVAEMGQTGKDPDLIAAERGFEAMDTGALEPVVDEAIAANADAWAKYCAGEQKAQGAIVGHVMKATKGQADGKAVARILEQRRSA